MNQSTSPAPASKPKPTLTHQILAGLLAGLVLVVVIAAFSGTDDSPEPPATASTAGSADEVTVKWPDLPKPAAAPLAPPPAPPAAPAGPADSIGNGTFLVGTDIQPGTYRSDGPLRTSCYWARLSGTGGELNDIIANNLGKGPAMVTIKKSDEAFESSGCTRWHKVK